MRATNYYKPDLTLIQKFQNMSWFLVLLIISLTCIGFVMLYSVAGGSTEPWVAKQLVRFGIGFFIMLAISLLDLRIWMQLSYPIYTLSLILIGAVELVGTVGMGAQRWIDLGLFNLQPSELMKVALVMALARYFHELSIDDIRKIRWLFAPVLMIIVPAGLVLIEPDLGTAVLLLLEGAIVLFIVGVRWWKFLFVFVGIFAAIPILWSRLHTYQQKRILTFFDPESDPLGAGYHILQSKIALGSGGVWGKGFLLGTQSNLNFLPEKHTDFIFTTLAEEFGLAGGLLVLGLYGLVLIYGASIALRVKSQFGRVLAVGITSTFFVYIFINIAMVMGLIPVVGVPLPLISYGGTAMATILFGCGLLLCAHIHRDITIPRTSGVDLI